MSWRDVQSYAAWATAVGSGLAVVVRLPYPPTANNLFAPMTKRSRRTGKLVQTKRKTAEAKAYAEECWYHVRIQRGHRGFTGPLAVLICATPPNNARRDISNLEKAVTDSLVAAGMMLDDSQVKDMRLVWAHSMYADIPCAPGVEVSVRELRADELAIQPPQPKQSRCRAGGAAATVRENYDTKHHEIALPALACKAII